MECADCLEILCTNGVVINLHANNLEGIRLYLPEAVWWGGEAWWRCGENGPHWLPWDFLHKSGVVINLLCMILCSWVFPIPIVLTPHCLLLQTLISYSMLVYCLQAYSLCYGSGGSKLVYVGSTFSFHHLSKGIDGQSLASFCSWWTHRWFKTLNTYFCCCCLLWHCDIVLYVDTYNRCWSGP